MGASQDARRCDPVSGHRRGRDARPGPPRGAGRPCGDRGEACRPGHHRPARGPRAGRRSRRGVQRGGLDRRGRRGDRLRVRARGQRHGPGGARQGMPRQGCAACARFDRLRVQRRRDLAVSGGRADRAAERLWAQQALRRTGRAGGAAGLRVRGAHRVAVRRAGPQLRQDDAAPRRHPGVPRRGRRPGGSADLVAGSGFPAGRTGRLGRPRRGVPRHRVGADHVARARAGGLRPQRTGPRAGPPDHQCGLRDTGRPALLQRAGPRPVGGGGDGADAGLAYHADRGAARPSVRSRPGGAG